MDKNLNLNQTSFITEKLESMAAIIKGLNIFSFLKKLFRLFITEKCLQHFHSPQYTGSQ